MQAPKLDPFIIAVLGLAALINLFAFAVFLLMLASPERVERFDARFPTSIGTLRLALAVATFIIAGLATRFLKRRLLLIVLLGFIPSVFAITFLLSQYADIFERSGVCLSPPVRDYALFVIDSLTSGGLAGVIEWASGHGLTTCAAKSFGPAKFAGFALPAFAGGVALWAFLRLWRLKPWRETQSLRSASPITSPRSSRAICH